MKTLFLDVDGVLNTDQHRMDFGIDFISPRLIKIVKKIIDNTGAAIVLSSDWRRKDRDKAMVVAVLGEAGLSLHSCTPVFDSNADNLEPVRKLEIQSWLDQNAVQVTAFAVLDDMNLPMDQLFLIDNNIGLTDGIADAVIKHLNI